jgi:hypothetical protein
VAKSRAVACIIKAIEEAGDVSQQALALQSTLIHPDIQAIAKTVGYDPTLFNLKARTAVYQMNPYLVSKQNNKIYFIRCH